MPSTILIVDDETSNRQTLELALSGEGYHLELAESGQKALDMLPAIQPDVVLLDVMMPGIDGYEVCRAIRNKVHTAEIPVLMVTSLDDRQSLLYGLESGADDFITKPFDYHILRARLRTITRLNRYRNLISERARLSQALKDLEFAYDGTIEGWSRAVDLRDADTWMHTQRVLKLTIRLAKILGLREQELIHLKRGVLLHDIGKIGVPDAILRKPGKLTDEEMNIMRQHPVLALKMLEPISYLRPALDIPYSHHEKWDGSGYPQGLQGDEIPLSARIFAVVDVWDALISDRPYRQAWTEQVALDYIREQAGRHFDPRVVEAFLDDMRHIRKSKKGK